MHDVRMEPIRLRSDALRAMITSDELCSVLDPAIETAGAPDWRACFAESMEVLAIAADNSGRVFESVDEATNELFASATANGFVIRELLRQKLLSLLDPAAVHVPSRRYAKTTREEDRDSAVAAAIFAATNPRLIYRQRTRIVDGSIWLLTERTPGQKYNTRYRSRGARYVHDPKLLAHEHVVQRKGLISRVLATTSPLAIGEILDEAVGCTVLRTEHDVLNLQKGVDGWQRYKQAGVRVYDCGEDGNSEPRAVRWSELGLEDDV